MLLLLESGKVGGASKVWKQDEKGYLGKMYYLAE